MRILMPAPALPHTINTYIIGKWRKEHNRREHEKERRQPKKRREPKRTWEYWCRHPPSLTPLILIFLENEEKNTKNRTQHQNNVRKLLSKYMNISQNRDQASWCWIHTTSFSSAFHSSLRFNSSTICDLFQFPPSGRLWKIILENRKH